MRVCNVCKYVVYVCEAYMLCMNVCMLRLHEHMYDMYVRYVCYVCRLRM